MRLRRALAIALILLVPLAQAGRVLAQTLQDQRSRLPPAVTCGDPVEGVWMSHRYYAHALDWYITQFHVRRVPGRPGELTGHIVAEHFNTGPDQPAPQPCDVFPGYHRRVMDATARGTWNETTRQITYQGVQLGTERVICGEPAAGYGFFVFTGTIDPALQEFNADVGSTNWTGSTPTVFRRIQCFDGTQPPVVTPQVVMPPPLRPGSRSGCDCGWR